MSHSPSPARPITILDCNEFWSPSGGGVRRYHLEKNAFFASAGESENLKDSDAAHYVFAMPDKGRFTEVLGPHACIEHIPAFKFPGNWEYRLILTARHLRQVIEKHRPDVIEIGSPYTMPWLVRQALAGLNYKPCLVGFWHADFPVTYIGRGVGKLHAGLGRFAEDQAWRYARWVYNRFDATWVASRLILDRMRERGMRNLHYMPLGVDAETFVPARADAALAQSLKDGLPERLTIFFGHRFSEEKGLRTLLAAYPELCKRLGHEPALVIAGTGPDLDLVLAAEKKHPHIKHIGYVNQPAQMAKWYATCEVGLMLSGWETFGLAVLEAMASGLFIVGADQGATREHIDASGAGVTYRVGNPASLVDAIEKAYRLKDAARAGGKARAYAESLSWPNCFRRELAGYRQLTQRPLAG